MERSHLQGQRGRYASSIGVKFANASSPPEEYSACQEPSASTRFLSSLRLCLQPGWRGYSTKWIADGSFRPFGSGRIVHGKGAPTCNPCSRCRLEGAFGCCAPDARNMVFGILESRLSVAGSLVGIFVCIAGVAEYLRKKSLYIAPWCLRKVQKKKKTCL